MYTAFKRLQIISFLKAFGDVAMTLRHEGPFELRQLRPPIGRPHIHPDEPPVLLGRIGRNADLALKLVLRGLAGNVHACAGDVEFPAVIDATNSAFLVSAPEKAGAAVRAEFIDDADPALGIAKGDKILGKNPDTNRRTIRTWKFGAQERGQPILAKIAAAKRVRISLREQPVLFMSQHLFRSIVHGRRRCTHTMTMRRCPPLYNRRT